MEHNDAKVVLRISIKMVVALNVSPAQKARYKVPMACCASLSLNVLHKTIWRLNKIMKMVNRTKFVNALIIMISTRTKRNACRKKTTMTTMITIILTRMTTHTIRHSALLVLSWRETAAISVPTIAGLQPALCPFKTARHANQVPALNMEPTNVMTVQTDGSKTARPASVFSAPRVLLQATVRSTAYPLSIVNLIITWD